MNVRRFLRIIAIVLSIGAALWLFAASTASATEIHWRELDAMLLAAALIVAFVQELFGALIARIALAAFAQRVAFVRLLIIVTAATSANSLVPVPAGIPARLWLQQTLLGIPLGPATAAIGLELLAGYGVLGMLASLGALHFGFGFGVDAQYLVALVLMIAAIVFLAWRRREQLQKRLRQVTDARPNLGLSATAVILNLVVIVLATVRLWLILCAAGHTVGMLDLAAALCIARVAGVASMIPMGLGSRDVTLTGLLALAGVPLSVALVAAAVDRVLSTLPYVTIAIAGWPLLRYSGAFPRRRQDGAL